MPDTSGRDAQLKRGENNMAQIEITKSHTLTPDQARSRAETIAKEMQSKFGIAWAWDPNNSNRVNVDAPSGLAKGAKGSVEIVGPNVTIGIDLPKHLFAFKPIVEQFLKQNLDKYLVA